LGKWLNYDELESNLCVEELIVTVNAIREKESRDRKFAAAIQGIDLDAEEVVDDITDLKGLAAAQEGFGIGFGLGYMEINQTS
jgi:hypothetical protein